MHIKVKGKQRKKQIIKNNKYFYQILLARPKNIFKTSTKRMFFFNNFSGLGSAVPWTVPGDGLKGTDVVPASSLVRQPTLLKQTEQNYIEQFSTFFMSN